jgi:hypothetical protein
MTTAVGALEWNFQGMIIIWLSLLCHLSLFLLHLAVVPGAALTADSVPEGSNGTALNTSIGETLTIYHK